MPDATAEHTEDLFWQVTMRMLGFNPADFEDEHNPPTFMPVRISWPQEGAPAWKIDEDVSFIRLVPHEDDDYARQIDSTYEAAQGTVIKKSNRTRVWEVQYIVYGPNADTNINKIKDGMFRQDIKRILSGMSVFLIPDLPPSRRVPELYGGRWWKRWDASIFFNEQYQMPDEDVGRIESVTISTKR